MPEHAAFRGWGCFYAMHFQGDDDVKKEEMAKVEAYLRKTFGTTTLSVRARPKKDDSAEVYIGEDFVAVLYREDEEGEVSYQFQMAILDIDLEEA